MSNNFQKPIKNSLTFVDVFAGCGGLSLGLINAGWKGFFAVEKNSDAFETLKVNLISSQQSGFNWPEWLPKAPIDVTVFLSQYEKFLETLKGKVDVLVGGPPCQGFSLAGRRTQSDPRNTLSEEYIRIVEKLTPRLLLIENVQGFTWPFKENGVKQQIEEAIPLR